MISQPKNRGDSPVSLWSSSFNLEWFLVEFSAWETRAKKGLYYCHIIVMSSIPVWTKIENSDCSENCAANKNTHFYVDMSEIHMIQASCVLCKRIRINPHGDYFKLSTLETMVKSWVFENQFQVRVLNLLHSICDLG